MNLDQTHENYQKKLLKQKKVEKNQYNKSIMNINKAETIRNPYALARWLAQKHGPRTKNGYKKYLPAL